MEVSIASGTINEKALKNSPLLNFDYESMSPKAKRKMCERICNELLEECNAKK